MSEDNERSFWVTFWVVVIILIGGSGFFLFYLAHSAAAHDHERPELNTWFRQQFSEHGPCCDGDEAKHIADVDWDSVCGGDKCHYRVHIYDRWWNVDPKAVVIGANLSGTALLWHAPTLKDKQVISIFIRCFMPGTMT